MEMSWYCPLPFNSISSDPSGYYALCCESAPSEMHCTKNTLSEFKNSDYIMKNGLLIGCHQGLNKKDILRIHSVIMKLINR